MNKRLEILIKTEKWLTMNENVKKEEKKKNEKDEKMRNKTKKTKKKLN